MVKSGQGVVCSVSGSCIRIFESVLQVTDPIDLWLCSNPCTPETPCLWDLDADPHERQETSAAHKDTVATLLARLQTLQRTFRNATTISDNGRFCDVLKTRQVSGIGYVIGPWIGV